MVGIYIEGSEDMDRQDISEKRDIEELKKNSRIEKVIMRFEPEQKKRKI